MPSITLSRRTLLGFGAASLGLLTPRLVVAATPTAPQVEGPFYPIHVQDEKDADLTRLQGHSERALGDVIVDRVHEPPHLGLRVPRAVFDVLEQPMRAQRHHLHQRVPLRAAARVDDVLADRREGHPLDLLDVVGERALARRREAR